MQENAVYFGDVGFVFSIQSGRTHATKVRTSDIENYNVTINKEAFEERIKELGLAGKEFNTRFEATQNLMSLLKMMHDYFIAGPEDTKLLDYLGFLIMTVIIESGLKEEVDRRRPEQSYQKGMKAVAGYIGMHFSEPISIDTLTEISGFSKTHFINSFKKEYGETPYSYIMALRLSKAKVLLTNTSLPLNEIALNCGFQKQNAFNNIFKKETGMTPTLYREKSEE